MWSLVTGGTVVLRSLGLFLLQYVHTHIYLYHDGVLRQRMVRLLVLWLVTYCYIDGYGRILLSRECEQENRVIRFLVRRSCGVDQGPRIPATADLATFICLITETIYTTEFRTRKSPSD